MTFVSPYSYCFNVSPYYMHGFGIKAVYSLSLPALSYIIYSYMNYNILNMNKL